ncbi:MAG: BTAD domain-containing putative transcriptional regulator [Gaiellaceae bacterium]
MQFLILGPLEVRRGDAPLPLGTAKQRALLAVLLLHANEVVSRGRLIDSLWGERPPESASHSLEAYVSRLRKILHAGGEQILVTRPPGYMLRVGFDELDLDRFERLAEEGRRALAHDPPAQAAALLREALGLWRGSALADVEYEPFAQAEAQRLEECRLAAVEDEIEAELALGRHAAAVPRLQSLVAEHPLRERLRGQLMLALYRSGRQADALQAYRQARRYLVEEFGLEPSPTLRKLEHDILAHDSTLGPVTPGPSPGARRVRPRPHAALAAAGIVVIGLVLGIVLATRASEPSTVGHGVGSGLTAVSVESGKAVLGSRLPAQPEAIAFGAGSLWLADPRDQALLRVDATTGAISDRIPLAGEPGSVVVGAGAIWAESTIDGTIARIDPDAERVTQTLPLGIGNAAALGFGQGGLWVADTTGHSLVEVSPRTGKRELTLPLDLRPTSLAVGGRAVWVADHDSGLVARVNPKLGVTEVIVHVGQGPAALALGEGALWVANSLDSTVSRIDPRTGQVVDTIPVGSGPVALAVSDGAVWVANQHSGDLSRIDPSDDRVVDTIVVGGQPSAVAIAGHRVWVGGGPSPRIHRGGTLTIVSTSRFRSIDPAVQTEALSFQFARLAYDGLVALEAAPGPEGLRLVPDLAISLPAPTAGGRLYTFQLRSGIRYSDGRLLRASDFRRSMERMFQVGSPGAGAFSGLVGAERCRKGVPCDLSGGVRADDAGGTVSFRLRRPDPDFLFKFTSQAFAAPVPPGTPSHEVRTAAVPGTGPYRIVRSDRQEVRFERNPFFHEWSHAAQPDGNPDAIVWRFVASPEAAIAQVEQGRADWVFGLLPAAEVRRLQVERPAQLHTNPTLAVDAVNMHPKAPFDDVRVRRALSYALDRRVIVRLYGGPAVATPSCQTLVSGLLGFQRYCPYTLHPNQDGRWTAPNLALARRLVAASGTRGERVVVWGSSDFPYIPHGVPAYVASVLRSLGYRASVHLVRFGDWNDSLSRRMQVGAGLDWVPNYPAPSAYVPGFFGCHGFYGHGDFDPGHACDSALDRQMRRADELQLVDPGRAAALWSRIDRELVDRAWWATTVEQHPPEFVSKRLRNFEGSPIGDFIADQAWLR